MRLWLVLPAVLPLTVLSWAGGDPPAADKPPPDEPDFKSIAPTFLAKHCVSCHGPDKKRGGIALHTFQDEQALQKDRKLWYAVLRQVSTGEMPPAGRPRPAPGEVEAFQRSVELAFDRLDRNTKPDPGRVTIRRLNRVEYNNTIRDLVGVDFQPAEDFPSDDVGHGFDNIGDVLSLSPVLLERYLAAAESITQRAIVVGEPPKPNVRTQGANYLSPGPPKGSGFLHFRTLDKKDTFHTEFTVSQPGEFKARMRGYGTAGGAEPVRVALSVDKQVVATLEVKPGNEKNLANQEAPAIKLNPGDHRVAVEFLNPGDGRAVTVEWLQLEGPLDTRPASHYRLLACTPGKSRPEQTREILGRFATRAFRRPASATEVEGLARLAEAAEKRGEAWEASLQLAMQAVLVSPRFLFRVELDDRPDSKDPHPLDDYQLASRLSYFLWSSMPDDELFDLAARKRLNAELENQVRRMLKDPRSKALVDNFAQQWLQLRPLKTLSPDPKLFPSFDEPLRAAMLTETDLFFQAIVTEDRSVLDLLDADFTFLNERLARHYGIADTMGNGTGQKATRPGGQPIRGDGFVRVSLQGGVRGGLLTQASVLTVTSNPTRTSPVKRGRWVLEQMLGTPPPPPPPDVPALDGAGAPTQGTLRQRMEQHRANPSCAACHARMDPIGFAFENFNAIGAFRAKDGDSAIDASGTLPDGRAFQGPGELKTILKGKKELFCRCLTEKMLTYALGRGLEYYDRRAVDAIDAALARNNYRFSILVTEIVRSDPFRLRRGKDGAK
jgi:hypothetical protein